MVVCMQIAPPDFDRMFGALADPTRRDIVRRAIDARGGGRRAGQPLPDELRGRAEARRHPRAGRPGHQGAHRAPQGRPHQPRGAAHAARRLLDQYEELWRGRDRPHDRAHRRDAARRSQTDDRHRRPQGPADPDHDPRRRVRRHARAGLAAVGRPAPARALVGAADLPRHRHRARPARRAAASTTT